jgi:hypothetical protein
MRRKSHATDLVREKNHVHQHRSDLARAFSVRTK